MNWTDIYRYESNSSTTWFQRISAFVLVLLALLFLSGLLAGCVSNKKYNEALDQIASLKVDQEMASFKKVDTLYKKSETIYELRQQLLATNKTLDSVAAALQSVVNQPSSVAMMKEGLKSAQCYFEMDKGRLSADLSNDILFHTGEATLTNQGREKIAELAASVYEYEQEVQLWVVGHTDGKPYASSAYDNWDLSAQRALTVTRALIDAGLDGTDIVAAARGRFDPESANDKRVGRLLNRRTEILILPKSEWSEAVAQFVTSM